MKKINNKKLENELKIIAFAICMKLVGDELIKALNLNKKLKNGKEKNI